MRIKARKLIGILFVVSFFLIMFANLFMLKNIKINIVYAQEFSEDTKESQQNLTSQDWITALESDLNQQGKSIISLLYEQRDFYKNEFNEAGVENKNIALAKLNRVEEAIEDISSYMYYLSNDNGVVVENDTSSIQYPYHVSPNCTCGTLEYSAGSPCANCIVYTDTKTAVTLVAVGFETRGWALAADLLWFNMSNTTPNIEYRPPLGTSIAEAPQIATDLAQNNELADGFEQTTPGRINGVFASTIEGDTYNALGRFYYSKTPAGNGMINVSIQDLYDWDETTGESSANVLLDTMLTAQELGILTPFYTKIDLTIPGYVPFNWIYIEEGVMITGIADDIANVIVPTNIKDLRVKAENLPDVNIVAIDANAFSVQTQIIDIALPNTVISIGKEAFNGCTNLISISLPDGITFIGDNTFTGCTSLTDITIPENVTSIGMGAFANCSSLNNIAIPAKAAYIGESVFAGCSNLTISVSTSNPNYSSQGNILYNKAKTKIIGSGAVVTNITIPKTVTEIGVSAFSDNTNIQNLEIYGTPKIADLAFNNCANLRKIYFYSYIIPEIGSGAFANNEFVLYVPHSKQSEYMADFSGYTSDIASIPIQVTFKVDGKVYKTLNTYFGANITGVDVPFKEGYTFNYWIDSDGNTYENGGLWDSTSSFTVEADWTARQSYINFVGYGTEGIAPILATYDLPIGTLPTPNVSGPVFIGWKDENGVYYTADTIWKQTNNLTLLADYEGEESGNSILYYVDLDQDGGEGGADNVKAEYMAPMPVATAPTRVGYIFKGYYTGKNGTGVKYYNADMSSAKNWDIASDRTLYAYWEGLKFTVNFAKNGGTGGTSSVQVTYGSVMPTSGLVAPTKLGYTFDGYYDENNKQYYIGPNMNSDVKWDKLTSVTLYAKWIKTEYTITLVLYDNMTNAIKLYYGDKVDLDYAPYRAHYEFKGYYEKPNGQGKCYVKGVLKQTFNNYYHIEPESTGQTWNQYSDGVLYAHWELLKANYSITVVSIGNGYLDSRSISITSGQSITLAANTPSGYTFDSWSINGVTYRTENVTYTFELHRSYITGEITIHTSNYSGSAAYSDGSVTLYFQKNADSGDDNCVAAGTLITLADGRQVPIESLRGDEMLLVWNLYTGRFDVAPILFIEHDALATYKIINLMFSDGTTVKVIYEHAFWDFNLNKYVFLRADAAQYVGHWFNKQTMDANGNMVWTKVQLMNVTITEEYTTAWSLVTYGHLCVYVNGMLSMPGATEGLINIFEVDSNTMQINQEKYLADIAKYGLFTYEEFVQIYSVPQTIFEAFGGEYLKVAIGKGLIGYNTLGKLIERYSEFFA